MALLRFQHRGPAQLPEGAQDPPAIGGVSLKRDLPAEGSRLPAGDDGAVVPTVRGLVKISTVRLAEIRDRGRDREHRQGTDGRDAEPPKLGGGLGSDAQELLDVERPDACRYVGFGENGEAVGLAEIRCELGEELVGADADAAGQSGRRLDPLLDRAADIPGLSRHIRDVDESLVEAHVLERAGEATQFALHPPGGALIEGEVDREKDRLRTQAKRHPQRHCRVDPIFPRLIGGRRDDAALARVSVAADDDGQPAKVRAAQQLHRHEEGVHVDVKDASHRRVVAEEGRRRGIPQSGSRSRTQQCGASAASAALVSTAPVMGFGRNVVQPLSPFS